MNALENTLKPEIELRITRIAITANELAIAYSVTATAPVYLVGHRRLPFVRMSADQKTVEFWQGIPPRNQAERNRAINILLLPDTEELALGAVVNKTTVAKMPLQESGYWLHESEYTPLPSGDKAPFKAVLIQGYGRTPLDPRIVRNIDELFAWQLTARSLPFDVKNGAR